MKSDEPGRDNLRRVIGRLESLPLRPGSARQIHAAILDEDVEGSASSTSLLPSTTIDPAWAVEVSRGRGRVADPLSTLVEHRWWSSSTSSGAVAEALARLWRHSAAVALAARRLAKEAGDTDPDALARAGLLHHLGLWALAAVAPEALVEWYEAADHPARLECERWRIGVEASTLGRTLAVRWGCESLVADAAWLHADLDADLNGCSDQPARLALIQQAYAMASTTPWAPDAERVRDAGAIDPRVRVLTAEVQARCGGTFVEADASLREERLTRDNARLRISERRLVAERASSDRFLHAFIEAPADEGSAAWAERAGLAWCAEPGVAAARVVWAGPDEDHQPEPPPRPPSIIIPLGDPARPAALVHLWGEAEAIEPPSKPSTSAAWDKWAIHLAERLRLGRQLDGVVEAHRGRVAREEPTRRRLMLGSMAEFAAGAGHELNNPLAVIVGRAQLLLAKTEDPDASRSLRAIITQAQRAARILRDLMYVARSPEPRPRPCTPEDVVRACLRDLQTDADARGVRIVADAREPGSRVWADPEPLRQLADILVRNALEASSTGGLVQFTATGDHRSIRWTVHDQGRGIGPGEGMHLFDPFYCGRAAGRGLGLGLPRARANRLSSWWATSSGSRALGRGQRSSSPSRSAKSLDLQMTIGRPDQSPTDPCSLARQ